MYVRLLRLPEAVRRRHDLSSIRFVVSTGSPCPPDVKHSMIDWWGPVIHEAYGSSELGYVTSLDSVEALRKPGSAERPLAGVTLAILDEDDGRPLPPGRAGLIYVHQPAFADFSYVGNDAARQRMECAGLKTRRRRRLSRRRRLPVHRRPSGRHCDLGRRQHLSG